MEVVTNISAGDWCHFVLAAACDRFDVFIRSTEGLLNKRCFFSSSWDHLRGANFVLDGRTVSTNVEYVLGRPAEQFLVRS